MYDNKFNKENRVCVCVRSKLNYFNSDYVSNIIRMFISLKFIAQNTWCKTSNLKIRTTKFNIDMKEVQNIEYMDQMTSKNKRIK